MRAATVSVGLVSPRSTCESIGALTPLRCARSRSDSDSVSRSAFTRAPIVTGSSGSKAAGGSAGLHRRSTAITVAIRAYVITDVTYEAARDTDGSSTDQGAAASGRPMLSPTCERATATDSARTYARAAASMMSVETPGRRPVKPSTSTTTDTSPSASWPSVTAPIVKSLSFARTPVAASIAWNTASIGPSPVNEPSAEEPSGSVTDTRACGGRREEASTSNQSSA